MERLIISDTHQLRCARDLLRGFSARDPLVGAISADDQARIEIYAEQTELPCDIRVSLGTEFDELCLSFPADERACGQWLDAAWACNCAGQKLRSCRVFSTIAIAIILNRPRVAKLIWQRCFIVAEHDRDFDQNVVGLWRLATMLPTALTMQPGAHINELLTDMPLNVSMLMLAAKRNYAEVVKRNLARVRRHGMFAPVYEKEVPYNAENLEHIAVRLDSVELLHCVYVYGPMQLELAAIDDALKAKSHRVLNYLINVFSNSSDSYTLMAHAVRNNQHCVVDRVLAAQGPDPLLLQGSLVVRSAGPEIVRLFIRESEKKHNFAWNFSLGTQIAVTCNANVQSVELLLSRTKLDPSWIKLLKHRAARRGTVDVMKMIMLKFGHDLDAETNLRDTAAYCMAKRGELDALNWLLTTVYFDCNTSDLLGELAAVLSAQKDSGAQLLKLHEDRRNMVLMLAYGKRVKAAIPPELAELILGFD